MSDNLNHLENECRRVAADFLALDWGRAKPQVRAAVNEMLSDSRLFTLSMAFLLKESTKLPVQAEPARRLNELVSVISMFRTRRRHQEIFETGQPMDRTIVA